MSKKKTLFSGAIGGFNRAQVVEYLEELNRKARVAKEQTDFEIARLETEVSELAPLRDEVERQKTELSELKSEKELLESDVENQKSSIEQLKNENEELSKKNAEMSKDYLLFREKAHRYDADKLEAGGILERSKTEADRILSKAKREADELLEKARREADEHAARVNAESEKLVDENIRKVKYLYKRREELLSAFEKVKDAAGGFYDSVASTLSDDNKDE